MNKSLLLSLLGLLCCFSSAIASPGDTVVVSSFVNKTIVTNPSAGNNRYSEWTKFPSTGATQYQKIYAYLTFECPDNMDCAEWDYLDPIYIDSVGGKNGTALNWEIARFITPYGLYWKQGSNWKHGWYYDVTDFVNQLQDSVLISYNHSGYEGTSRGWKINLTFYMVEGTPARNVLNVTRLKQGGYRYDDSIEIKYLTPVPVTLGAQTQQARIKIIQSGHGMDTDNCSEFCPKQRTVKVDGNTVNQRLMWRECGFNSLFPQAGTWLYDRGNWCPGAEVKYDHIELAGIAPGSSHTVDIDMETVPAANHGNQVITAYMVEYGAANFTTDASLESIVSPSKEYEYTRVNPICDEPKIVIKNNGSAPLTSLTIKYGAVGGTKSTHQWTGNLAYLQADTVVLTAPMVWGTNNTFEVQLEQPNAGTDENTTNDRAVTTYTNPPAFPDNKIIVRLVTNKNASENRFLLRNITTGQIAFQRNSLNNQTTYRDTIALDAGHCYSFEIYDDGPAPDGLPNDGLAWWANAAEGSGTLALLKANGIPFKNFAPDFGTKILYQFMAQFPLSAANVNLMQAAINVMPNPSADGMFTLEYAKLDAQATVEVYTIAGVKVYTQALKAGSGVLSIDLSRQPKGMYILKVASAGLVQNTQKLIIQ